MSRTFAYDFERILTGEPGVSGTVTLLTKAPRDKPLLQYPDGCASYSVLRDGAAQRYQVLGLVLLV